MQEEISLRQHWFVVPELGLLEQAILDQLDREELDRQVTDSWERNNQTLPVVRWF